MAEAVVPDVAGVRPVSKSVAQCDLVAAIGLNPEAEVGTLELYNPSVSPYSD
jgi:hypothetical protein